MWCGRSKIGSNKCLGHGTCRYGPAICNDRVGASAAYHPCALPSPRPAAPVGAPRAPFPDSWTFPQESGPSPRRASSGLRLIELCGFAFSLRHLFIVTKFITKFATKLSKNWVDTFLVPSCSERRQ